MKRNYSIELLRILAMIAIVATHFTSFFLVLKGFDYSDPHLFFNWFIRTGGFCGTTIFILISAFFMSKSSFKIKRFLILWLEVWLYSTVIYLVATKYGNVNFSPKGLIHALTPVLSENYWFITSYIVLFILSPFVNCLINGLTTNSLKKFTIILLVLFCFIPFFEPFFKWVEFGGGYGIVWMLTIYFTGAYIRRLYDEGKLSLKKHIIWPAAIISWFLPLVSKMVIAYATTLLVGEPVGSSIFYQHFSIFIILASILTFLAFLSTEIKGPKTSAAIKFLSASSLSVYLIHNHPATINWLWKDLAPSFFSMIDVPYELQVISLIIGIYLICTIVDLIRRFIFRFTLDPLLEKPFIKKKMDTIDNWFKIQTTI